MRTRPGPSRAVTSSPGSCNAKPRTSNPQATFDTVAGANAVTAASIATLILLAMVTFANRRDQILAEGAIEIVARIEAPVVARRRVVHRRRPGVDDALAFGIHFVIEPR